MSSRASRFDEIKAAISGSKEEVEVLREELESWLDNMPENLQDSPKAETLQAAIDELQSCGDSLEEAEGIEVEFPGMFG